MKRITRRYAKLFVALSVFSISGLFLLNKQTDDGLASDRSNFRLLGTNAVRRMLIAVGLDTETSSEVCAPVASGLPRNVAVKATSGSRVDHRASLVGECRLTPQADVVLPNNTLYLITPCRHPDPHPPVPIPEAVVKKKVILFYNRPVWFHPEDPCYEKAFKRCVLSHACVMTDDRSVLQDADAVLVHVPQLAERDPPTMTRRSARQVWIAFGMESPYHFEGHYGSPSWKGVFNWTLTYRTDSDIFIPYDYLTLRPERSPARNYTEVASKKSKPVAWILSHCDTPSRRTDYVQELSRHIQVDVYGGCGVFRCPKEKDSSCLRLLNTTYHFYLSFENSFCKDYVTEKLFKIYDEVDVIPVVRGGADYEGYFPAGTFVNAARFSSPRDLAAHLKRLMTDKTAYAQMLKLKDRFAKYDTVWNVACSVCRKLHDTNLKERVYPDFMRWMWKDACRLPSDV